MRQETDDAGDSTDQEYEGIYYSHWEAGGLDIVVGRWFFGLLPKREYWLLIADGADWPDMEVGDIGAPKYRLRFLGRRGPRGIFGHMGMCCREVMVSKILECTRLP